MSIRNGQNDLTTGTVWKKLLVFFVPIAAGTIIQQFYNAADGLIVGRFVGTGALAAVGGLYLLYFLFHFTAQGIPDRWLYFSRHLLSRMIQTFLWSILFYFLNRLIYRLLGEEK